MIVLGLDPGSRRFGWGVVKKTGTRLLHVAHGTFVVLDEETFADRLVAIEEQLTEVVNTHRPSHASVETLFFARDPQAAAKLGHARGVGLLVCARSKLTIAEYAPTLVKRTVAGFGRAEKAQVAQMMRAVLNLSAVPSPDAADALALAVTHLQHLPLLQAEEQAKARLAAAMLKSARGVHRGRRSTV